MLAFSSDILPAAWVILSCGMLGCRGPACWLCRCWLTGVRARGLCWRAGLVRLLCAVAALGVPCGYGPAAGMRWLRMAGRQAIHRVSGARPVRRHQPRAMLVVAGSLMEKVRSAPVRRA